MTNTVGETGVENISDELSPKEKLLRLPEYLPGEEKIVYEFAAFLATRVNDSLVPMGFNLGAELAIADLAKGIDGYTQKPIEGAIAGYPPFLYSIALPASIGRIAKAVYGDDFGAEVENVRDKIRASLEGKQ